MKSSKYTLMLFLGLSLLACQHKQEVEDGSTVEIIKVVSSEEEPLEPPPPPGTPSKFKTLQAWLTAICETEKPQKANLIYNVDLFESSDEYMLSLTGVSRYEKSPSHFVSHIEFEPTHMYFPLPKEEYKGMTPDQVRGRLTGELKNFTETETFKHSFFREAKSITTGWGGEIWAK